MFRSSVATVAQTSAAALTLLFVFSCAEEHSSFAGSTEDAPAEMEEALYDSIQEPLVQTLPASAGEAQRAGSQQAKRVSNFSSDRDLGQSAGGAIVPPTDRLLEYSLTLQYRTEDYREARKVLMKIANEHGHLLSSSASTDPQWTMNASMRVRSAELYKALEALDALGELEYENITATDHTESQVLAERQSRRALQRVLRRKRGPTGNKQWAERERLIAQSEEMRDAAEHEQWRVRDRVKFAQIEVRLLGPDLPAQIVVPPYHNALIILFNGFLELLYALILGLPLWLIAGALWWHRARIARLFTSRRAEG